MAGTIRLNLNAISANFVAPIIYSTYSTVNSNSATWNGSYTILNSLTAQTNSVTSTVSSTSASWNSVYISYNGLSAVILSNTSLLTSNSALWQAAYTVVFGASAQWNSVFSTVNANSGSWGSGAAASVFSTVQNASAYWQSTFNTVSSLSSQWSGAVTFISTNSGSLSGLGLSGYNAYLTLSSLSSNWQSTFNTVSSLSSMWGSNTLATNSGYWNSVYSTVSTFSGNWGLSAAGGSVFTGTVSALGGFVGSVQFNASSANVVLASTNTSYRLLIPSTSSLIVVLSAPGPGSFNQLVCYKNISQTFTIALSSPYTSQVVSLSTDPNIGSTCNVLWASGAWYFLR